MRLRNKTNQETGKNGDGGIQERVDGELPGRIRQFFGVEVG